jgi:hypothetical protein
MAQGTADLTNEPSPYYAPGELGCSFSDQNTDGEYRRVILDSGATAGPVGAVAQGQLAFWKDEANSLVTNDKNQCDVGPTGAINRVAGIFQLAVTTAAGVNGSDGLPLRYMTDLVIRKRNYNVASASALIGAQATADTTASVARAVYTTGVNTAPVSQVLGVWASSTITSNKAPMDVSIGFAE